MGTKAIRPISRLLALVALSAACGPQNTSHEATNSNYRGEPIASVQGQITANPGTSITGPVRLALAWYPIISDPGLPPNHPHSIVTEDLPYQGTFPLSYSFNIYNLPPADAIYDLAGVGGSGRAAVGILIAYQDDNGNGTLDTIPPGGTPIDTVLGSSVGDVFSAPPTQGSRLYEIVYLDGMAPPNSPAFQQGLNLLQFDLANNNPNGAAIVPFTTPVPINLSASRDLNFLVCEAVFTSQNPDPAALGACGIPAQASCGNGGPCPSGLHVTGSIGIVSNASAVDLNVVDGSTAVTNATVSVNQRAIPFNSARQRYSLFDSSTPFLLDGTTGKTNEIRIQVAGSPDLVLAVPLAGNFHPTAPAFNASIKSGSTVSISWTASAGAKDYRVEIFPPGSGAAQLFNARTTSLSTTTTPISYTGPATLNVQADLDPVTTPDGSFVVGYVNNSIPLQFVP